MTNKVRQKFPQERRKRRRENDGFFRTVVFLNTLAWMTLIGCLIMFHLARPEMVSGVQQFWGIEGRTSWSEEHIDALVLLLQGCLLTTLVTMLLRVRRNRRKEDRYGMNLFILTGISSVSLFTLNAVVA